MLLDFQENRQNLHLTPYFVSEKINGKQWMRDD